MWNFTTTLLQRVAGLNPLKSFLKYIFHRLSKDFLDREPTIDFRNGILDLQDLPLSASKINKSLLCSSPYSMHSGCIKNLRIVLPNLTELSTRSIEVCISSIEICLRPNKQFESNFSERMAELKEQQKYYQQENEPKPNYEGKPHVEEDNSIDFFKQLIKQILTNIKIKVANVCVQVFMNTPSDGKVAKPQYYSMVRIPVLTFERFNDMEIGKQSEEFSKYRLEVPQISAHLLREDMKLPEYENLQAGQKDFPWLYPPVSHPSTILLIGSDDLKNNPSKINVVFRISKDVKKKSQEVSIRVELPNIEFMVEGYQLQILLKYLKQLQEFKQVWRQVMDKLKWQDRLQDNQINIEESRELEVPVVTYNNNSRKSLRNPSGAVDIFASVVIAFEDDGTEKRHSTKRKTDFIDSIMLENDSEAQSLKKQMLTFNRQISAELKDRMMQDRHVEYKNSFIVRAEVALIRLYLLKYNAFTDTQYERCWAQAVNKKFLSINQHIPCSYFQVTLKSLAMQMDDPEHINVSVRKANIKNIKLYTSAIEEDVIFHDPINQSTMFDTRGLSDSPKDRNKHIRKKIVRFVTRHGDHYCSSNILSISSRDDSRVFKEGRHKRYNLLANSSMRDKLDNCLTVKLVRDKKELKVSLVVGYLSLLVDIQAIRDIINIAYPMFIYRHLVENINMKRQEPSQNTKKNNPMSIYFSNYDMTGREAEHSAERHTAQHHNKSEPKKSLSIQMRSLRVAVMDSPASLYSDLIEKERAKIEDRQSFENSCFCDYSSQTVGLEIREVKCHILKKTSSVKANELELGITTLSTSRHANFAPVAILTKKENQPIEVFYEKVYTEGFKLKHFLGLYIAKCELSVLGRDQPKQIVDRLHQYMSNLIRLKQYFEGLREQMALLQTGKKLQIKEESLNNKVPLILMMDIENANVYYAGFGVLVRHLIVEFETDKITVKINDAIIISLENRKVILRSSDINQLTEQSFDPEGYSIERFSSYSGKISSDRIIVWLSASIAFNSPNFETHDRSYYAWMQKQFYAIEILVTKNAVERPVISKACEIKQTETFCFVKPKKAEKNKEQEEHLSTELKIKVPLGVRSCELQQLPALIGDLKFLKDHTDFIRKQLKIVSRGSKPSEDREVNIKKMTFTIRAERLVVDSFPYFDKLGTRSVLSNCRSVISLHDFYFQMCKVDTKVGEGKPNEQMNFHILLKELAGSFLVFHDSHPESNLITLPIDHFDDYGFRQLLTIKGVNYDMQIDEILGKKEISIAVVVDDVSYSSSASTTVYLQNHMADILKCIPKKRPARGPELPYENNRKPNVCEFDSDCDIPSEESEDSAEDLSEIDIKIEKEKRQRTDEENELRGRDIVIVERPRLLKEFNVKMVGVKSLSINIYSGDDFSFLKTNPSQLKYREEAVAIELNEDNSVMSVTALEYEKFVDTRIRFRAAQPNWHTFVKTELSGIEFKLLKQTDKAVGPQSDVLQCRLRVGNVLSYLSQLHEDKFIVAKIDHEFVVGVEKLYKKIKVKTSFLPKVQMGFSSTLKFISNERKQTSEQIANSFFLRKQNHETRHNYQPEVINDLLLFVPEFNLILDVKLIGLSFLSQLEIKVSELFFHNPLSKSLEEQNKAFVKSWIGSMLKGNIGSVLGNTLVMLLTKGMWLILTGLKQLLGLPGELLRTLMR